MTGKTAVIVTCAHATPEVDNTRADLLGKLLYDVRPDYVVDLGDGADMKALNSYDTRYPQQIVTQNYEKDINCYNDFQERVRYPFVKAKVKRPRFYGFEGNHENRIKKAIANDPRLEGTTYGVSFSHLETNRWFDEYHEYENSAPAIHNYDGIDYSHFLGSGNYGTAISGEHHAYNMLKKRFNSVTVGHSHKLNMYFKHEAKAIGLVAGCFKGGPEKWAGQAGTTEWWHGVIIKRNIQDGWYDMETVSTQRLIEEYWG